MVRAGRSYNTCDTFGAQERESRSIKFIEKGEVRAHFGREKREKKRELLLEERERVEKI